MRTDPVEALELLTDGRKAFPEIIRQIRLAKHTVAINMFIWRNDAIGNALAGELLTAADRGVRITISKDRYGVICETCEEDRRSFFHRKLNPWEQVQSLALYGLYDRDKHHSRDGVWDRGELLERMLRHPGITVQCEENKCDHSKYYVFDDQTVIFGGINVEDKENGQDYHGRAYHDYMVKVSDPALTEEFLCARAQCRSTEHFPSNRKKPVRCFAMKDTFLQLINRAQEELILLMAYLSPIPEVEQALVQASRRVKRLTVVIPRQANFQDDLNRLAVNRLMALSHGKIRVLLYPGMLHAKLMISEKSITLGSCNITKKAFGQLDELNLLLPRDGSAFDRQVRQSVQETLDASSPVEGRLPLHPIWARLESLLM